MQYILSEDEYQELKSVKKKALNTDKRKLQQICTLAAIHIPIVPSWNPNAAPEPWGCVLASEDQDSDCCDECPVTSICPYEYKQWSQ